ncbi:TPA: 4-alpha-glucanotransferase [Streptococcus equi subsp. zooepidemicus]|uniref:4-alpha-glucanotransferase n=1 Tax=Streptococcus equi subsp. ruminatorum CECT 5772 TaxID=1051981 RepID=A0A922T4C4_9STRE|nr:4-alpha-glucanotransferase [Streptococcus equi]KED03594.1 4-alpha-glucanotransferase [Streptococcus equi subsp. ruminatorum CECT 5772]HEL0246135.1 4-alpha-glucanotransferase [Streptococcus equi subsp. zooepidemicus]HEL1011242.1 4-alpha-glucanotransferase [Streptococcus equi subsp. ruminatorum]HEL1023278.1 4-alpha-glucanotransferase [Streptococcus equi subsp. ruminatorum CECT 5772]
MTKRASGILMHISSLPGPFGIGSFGKEAFRFVDFLKETKQTYWQILPLTTTSFGDSPYQSFSAIAGNTHFIDLELLAKEGYLQEADYAAVDFGSNPEAVDYAQVFKARRPLLEKAVQAFVSTEDGLRQLAEFEATASWLNDFAEFMAIKEHFNHKALQDWEDMAIVKREEAALLHYRKLLAKGITYHKVCQYFFYQQWLALKAYANQNGIAIIGDMPIYVSADSVEVWTMPELFKVDADKKPIYIAGVPADGFSEDGQLWGNPIYNWESHEQTGFAWWIHRIKESFKLYDKLRIDHFKGFSDFWEIPGGDVTAKNGHWESAPGIALFTAVREALGDLPIIAENLGYIDEKAEQLLASTGFLGMKILEFGLFDVTSQSFDLPHHYDHNCIVYTGTHDNEVVNGWYEHLSAEQVEFVNHYIHKAADESITKAMLRTIFATVCDTVILCMQDLLDKSADSRMNMPNTVGGNWQWRMLKDDLKEKHKAYLIHLTELYGRANNHH